MLGDRKGQVTIFIIVVILIVAFSFIAAIKSYSSNPPVQIIPIDQGAGLEASQAKSIVQSCLDDASITTISDVLDLGYPIPFDTVDIDEDGDLRSVSFYMRAGKPVVPSSADLVSSMKARVEREIDSCLDGRLSGVPGVAYSPSEVIVDLTDESVLFQSIIPVTLSANGQVVKFSKFSHSEPVALAPLRDYVDGMVANLSKTSGLLDLDTLFDSPYKVELQTVDERIVLVKLTDFGPLFEEKPVSLRFVLELSELN